VTAAELLADLARDGFTLVPEGEGIRVSPVSRLTPARRRAIAAHKPALLALLAAPRRPAHTFVWDQAEAERLLAEVREATAHVEAAVNAGQAPPVRLAVLRTWLEVAERYVSDRECEAAGGWDALELLRGAARQARRVAAAGAAGSGASAER
jgi:hypothetical protein